MEHKEKSYDLEELEKRLSLLPTNLHRLTTAFVPEFTIRFSKSKDTIGIRLIDLKNVLRNNKVSSISITKKIILDSSYKGLFTNVKEIIGDVICNGDMFM
jgi:hypothetical protein